MSFITRYIFLAGTVNFLLYNYLQSWYDMYWSSYVLHVLNVSTVLIFPVAGIYSYYRQQQMKEQLQQFNQVRSSQQVLNTPLTISGSGELEKITLETQQQLYIEQAYRHVIQ